jgi:hypothetical protein
VNLAFSNAFEGRASYAHNLATTRSIILPCALTTCKMLRVGAKPFTELFTSG